MGGICHAPLFLAKKKWCAVKKKTSSRGMTQSSHHIAAASRNWPRREWESNPRILADPVFETGAFDHSAISPYLKDLKKSI